MLIHDPIVKEVIFPGMGFDIMTDGSVVDIAVTQGKPLHVSDINIMSKAPVTLVVHRIIVKFGTFDENLTGWI